VKVPLLVGAAVLAATYAVGAAAPANESQSACATSTTVSELFAGAREAVGGGALRSLVARGVGRGFTATASPTTWVRHAILPDRFLYVQTSDKHGFATVSGFNREVPLFGVRGSTNRVAPRENELEMQREQVDRFMLGWFGRTRPATLRRFRFTGRSSYRGQPAVLISWDDAPPGLVARVWLSAQTCTPLALGYERMRVPMEPVDATASVTDLTRVEEVFLDRRREAGFDLPRRIAHFFGGVLRSESIVQTIEINGEVDPGVFETARR